jgi:pyruvate/2-oxoglutarate/acetoin dehydrogenase E1 component
MRYRHAPNEMIHAPLKSGRGEGVWAEVVELQTIRPLDAATILRSLAKTNRIVVVGEGPRRGGWAGEVLALVTEQGLSDIDDAFGITTPDAPIPYSPTLEDDFLPGADRILAALRERA